MLHRYAELIDAGDFDGLGELLAECELSGPGLDSLRGAEQITQLYATTTRRHADGTPLTAHVISNPIIELDEDERTAWVRSRFTVLQATDSVALQPIIAGRYHDRFERREGEWVIVAREMRPLLFGELSEHLTFDADELRD